MDYLKERLYAGYKLVVVSRRDKSVYWCSKQENVIESGDLKNYDLFAFEEGVEWEYCYNVIYKIKDLISE